jgi:hypothetical protein
MALCSSALNNLWRLDVDVAPISINPLMPPRTMAALDQSKKLRGLLKKTLSTIPG